MISQEIMAQLREKAEAIPAEERDWYTLDQPWLGRDMETMILSGSPDPHAGVMVCDFSDAALAGVEDRYEDGDWSARNWAMAEYIAAADPNTVLSLIKEISELREALKPFAAEAEKWSSEIHFSDFTPALDVLGSACNNCGDDPGYEEAAFTIGDLRNARAKLEGSGA